MAQHRTPAPAVATEDGLSWQNLRPAQREALAPLQQEWPRLDGLSKRKWIALAARFPAMSPDERARVQTRMADWAKLTPKQRGKARLHFQEARELPRGDRQAKWQAYQALSAEQKKQLAARATSARHARPRGAEAARVARLDPAGKRAAGARKPIELAAPALTLPLPPTSIAPTLLQARPGATTVSVSKRPAPLLREPAGTPKIAATPDLIDPLTLLPRRGPQAVAAPAAAPEPKP